ncbi:uncharacterized protein B0H18DRAFT_674847 [Fomitopsis serialis]|uniref:uncharacterized protein n=1 Tax=Fomitopsis serialis TaxID=139415 RepID=UPI002007231D|nr:uncharacterized protein B0H18DRAFT_674847 [Neoantrodia serialis]KAH9933034.1 hypothetical protein B0H18DRAFT_674847 [Neoantrodia serialis]
MLFRADFVRQKHVPGSIETSHISLSKIIGNIWRALPWEEREQWVQLAKKAKAEHKLLYPNYKFRPVHNKDKKKARDAKKKPLPAPVADDDERRTGVVAQLMLGGKKGEELATAVRAWESRNTTASPDMSFGTEQLYLDQSDIPLYNPVPLYAGHRRSSSVPLPAYNQIAIPSVPFLVNAFAGGSRAPSPVNHISGISRNWLGHRRASSVQPIPSQPWAFSSAVFDHPQQQPQSYSMHQDSASYPEPDHSLFQSAYLTQGSSVLSGQAPQKDFSNYAPNHSLRLEVSPLEGIPPLSTDFSQPTGPYSASTAGDPYSATTYSTAPSPVSAYAAGDYSQHSHMGEGVCPLDGAPWPQSGASSAFSGSPALTDHSLADAGVVAPQPLHPSQHVQVEMEEWSQMEAAQEAHLLAEGHPLHSFEQMVSSMEVGQQAHAADGYDMFATEGYADAATDAFPAFDEVGMNMNMGMTGF